MTAQSDLKKLFRARQAKTGESYTTARAHVLRARAALLGERAALPAEAPPADPPVPEDAEPQRVDDAIVLKVNQQSARVRLPGEETAITFHSTGVWQLVPGHLVTLIIKNRWRLNGHAQASGTLENPRIDVEALGLEPLPLEGGELMDLRDGYEPFRRPDSYAPLWEQLTARPRPSFEFDEIAWGALPGHPPEENPVSDAQELFDAGDDEGARKLLMETLASDLRCIDAHAHLGVLLFERCPQDAMVHYEMGIQIGGLSLPAGFDGLLVWGRIHNRPFLRCLQGYGLCLWRLGRLQEARGVFERILSLNPNDNQGVRGCLEDLLRGGSWEELHARERAALGELPVA